MAHGWRLLEAVTGESACAPEAVEIADRTQYGLMVGRHLVEASPSRSYSGGAQPRRAALDDRSDGVEHGPIDFGVETRRFIRKPHSEEQALTLRVEVERSPHVDRHGMFTRPGRHRLGDEDVAWVGFHGNGDSSHFANFARPGPRAIEDCRRDDFAGRSAHCPDVPVMHLNACDGDAFQYLRAQPPRGAGVSRSHGVRTGDAIARAESATEDVVAAYEWSKLPNL